MKEDRSKKRGKESKKRGGKRGEKREKREEKEREKRGKEKRNIREKERGGEGGRVGEVGGGSRVAMYPRSAPTRAHCKHLPKLINTYSRVRRIISEPIPRNGHGLEPEDHRRILIALYIMKYGNVPSPFRVHRTRGLLV